jgi:hypothetical protein
MAETCSLLSIEYHWYKETFNRCVQRRNTHSPIVHCACVLCVRKFVPIPSQVHSYKVNLSLLTTWTHTGERKYSSSHSSPRHLIELCGQFHAPAALSLDDRRPVSRWIRDWVDLIFVVDITKEKKFLVPVDNRTSIPRSDHYSDWAILVPVRMTCQYVSLLGHSNVAFDL